MGGTWRSSASSSQRNLVNILLDIDVFSLASALGDSQLCRKLDAVGDVAVRDLGGLRQTLVGLVTGL